MRLLVETLFCIIGVKVTVGLVQPLQSLPYELDRAFEMYRNIGDLSEQPGEMVFWGSVQDYLCKFAKDRTTMTSGEYEFFRGKVNEFMSPLLPASPGSRVKRQATTLARRRRELRMLSRRERELYFTAVNALKRDTRLSPNVYDVLADFHTGDLIAVAHFGPNFPSWHRLYLWLFESFLRLHVPGVTIPYWASVLDDEIQDSTQSVLWTSAFFGNGVGPPTIGPFRNWGTINPARLFTRNIGNGPLYSYDGVDAIVNKTRNSEILLPSALAESNFEQQHGGPHVWVGGSMNRLDQATRDPIFFSHHSFVDQIWERFRFNQFSNGVNPGLDYPWIEGEPGFRPEHRPNGSMGFFPNNELNIDYQNSVGYSNIFFQLVQYDRVPVCPTCGGSPYLFCNARERCEARTVAQMRGMNLEPIGPVGRAKRQSHYSYTDADTCPKPSLINDYDYKTLHGTPPSLTPVTNTDWVYVAVKIVSKRTDDYKSFNFYSLDGKMTENAGMGLKNTFLKHASHLSYSNCQKQQDIAGKIKIVSHGLNYDGYAEEYAVTDNRLGVSVSYGFVPVKRPDSEGSEVIIAAFDSCGRVCKPYCSNTGASAMEMAGGIKITNDLPLQYSNSYAEATLNAWQIPSATSCPKLDYDNIPLSFFCEYTDSWIWSSTQQGPDGMGPSNPQPNMAVPESPWMAVSHGTVGNTGFQGRRPGRGRGRGTAARKFVTRGGVPFHGAASLHAMVPDALSNYSQQRQGTTLI